MIHSKLLHKPNLGILLLRLALGAIFIYAGYTKLSHMQQTIGFFAMGGMGAFWAYVVAITEFAGGILMVAGYATQIAGFLLAFIMLVAIIKVHAAQGFGMSMGPLMIGVSALAVAISGCGKYSICGTFHGKKCDDCKGNGKCACQH